MMRFVFLFTLLTLVTIPALAQSPPRGLRDLPAVKSGRLKIGTAGEVMLSKNYPGYLDTMAREFNWVTPEWTMKMETNQPRAASAFSSEEKDWDFGLSDSLIEFAQKNKMQVRGHAFVWHEALPEWFSKGSFSPEQLKQIMANRISTLMRHNEAKYPGFITVYDVVNEAVSADCKTIWAPVDNPDGKNCLAYVRTAFQMARKVAMEINPKIDLYYNEYGAEGVKEKCNLENGGSKTCKVFQLVSALKKEGLIDGVGLQTHLSDHRFTPQEISINMDQIADLGLKVQVSEMDFAAKPVEANASFDDIQAATFGGITKACLDHANCDAVIFWGFLDKASWELRRGRFTPLLFTEGWKRKASYDAVATELGLNKNQENK